MKYNRFKLKMKRWEQILDHEEDLHAIMTGEQEMPPYPGDPGSAGSRLYRTVLAVICLFRGDFDGAHTCCKRSTPIRSRCSCRIWRPSGWMLKPETRRKPGKRSAHGSISRQAQRAAAARSA